MRLAHPAVTNRCNSYLERFAAGNKPVFAVSADNGGPDSGQNKPRSSGRKAKPAAVKPDAAAKITAAAQEQDQAVKPDFEAEVERLAELPELEYAHRRKDEAKRLGVPVSELTRAVKARRKAKADAAKAKAKTEAAQLRARGRRESRRDSDTAEYAPQYSEEWLALSFTEKHHHHLQYIAEQDAWMFWNGVYWEREKTLRVYDMIRAECRAACSAAKADGSEDRIVFDLSKAKTRAAVETLTRSDRRLASKLEDWDADDWLLGTPGGIIDLRTGKNIGFDPSKRITTITAVAPGGECPTWLKFLDQVTKGNKELQAYLQRGSGYDLTGFATEQIIRFIYGDGGNGKGVYMRATTGVMGKLHATANVESFVEKKYATHSTDIAGLHRARAVSCNETRSGQVWDDAKLKGLSGGDIQKARFMRCDEFEFLPKFTLTVVGNHKPKFRAIDDGMRRRLHLIPFDFSVEQAGVKDTNLDKKLRAEWPGILQWMIEGCLEWQRIGLNPPECVLTATNEYLESEDMVSQWFAQNCIQEPGARIKHSVLFADWKEWANNAHVAVGDVRNLSAEIEKRHGDSNRYMRDKVLAWKNLRLKTFEERCNEDAEDARQAKKGDEGGNAYIDRLGGDSSSALYAHTHARTGGRSILEDPPLPPLPPSQGHRNGHSISVKAASHTSRASQANGRNGFNGGSVAEGNGKAQRGTRISGTLNRCSVSAALATLDDDGNSDSDGLSDNGVGKVQVAL